MRQAPTIVTPLINVAPTLRAIKHDHLACLTAMRHLTRAPHELFCLLFCLLCKKLSESSPASAKEMDDRCMCCCNNVAIGYRTRSGAYDINEIDRKTLRDWAVSTTVNEGFIDQLSNINPLDIEKDRMDTARAIVKRGDTKRSKRSVSFESRIRDTLTQSHVYLLQWCVGMIGCEKEEEVIAHKSLTSVSSVSKTERGDKVSSLAFPFLPTIPLEIPYVKSMADRTMVGGRMQTIKMIREMMAMHCPEKNVNESIELFLGREVVLLRKLQSSYDDDL